MFSWKNGKKRINKKYILSKKPKKRLQVLWRSHWLREFMREKANQWFVPLRPRAVAKKRPTGRMSLSYQDYETQLGKEHQVVHFNHTKRRFWKNHHQPHLFQTLTKRVWQATRVQFSIDLWNGNITISIKDIWYEIWLYIYIFFFLLLAKMNLFRLNQFCLSSSNLSTSSLLCTNCLLVRKSSKVIILMFNFLESHLYVFLYLKSTSFSTACPACAVWSDVS